MRMTRAALASMSIPTISSRRFTSRRIRYLFWVKLRIAADRASGKRDVTITQLEALDAARMKRIVAVAMADSQRMGCNAKS